MWTAKLPIIRLLFAFNLVALVVLPVEFNLTGALVAVALYYVFGTLGIVASFHRFLSHNSFVFRSKTMEIVWSVLGHLSGSGSAIGWVAIHRLHHKAPDTLADPHSPIHGVWRTLTVDYRYNEGQGRLVRDLFAKPYLMVLHKYYFLVLGAYVGLLGAAFGLEGVYYGFMMPSVITLLASGITNYVAHVPALGYQTYPEAGKSTNAWWSALFNCGEGWHNNHHKHPESYTTREKWWEFDLAGFAIGWVKI